MLYTLGQAAKATGRSKPTIQRAIKNGQISATRNENGSYIIDPSELHRVFPTVTESCIVTGNVKQSEPPVLQGEVQLLRELLRQVEGERDDLRRRLDEAEAARREAATETRRLTLLLTHQREEPSARLSLWRRLTGKR